MPCLMKFCKQNAPYFRVFCQYTNISAANIHRLRLLIATIGFSLLTMLLIVPSTASAQITLINVDSVTDDAALQLNGAKSVTTAVVGGATFLFAAGRLDDGVSVFMVDAGGQLANVVNVTDDATLQLRDAASVTTAVIDSTTYLFVAGELDDGVSVFKVGAGAQLTNVDNVTDDATLELNGASSVTTAVVSGATYLFVAGRFDNGVSVFKVDASGQLSNVDNVTDAGALELNGAASVTTAVIGGATYLFVASESDLGVSVFKVADGGLLTNVDNVTDDATLQLDGARSVTTAVIGGTAYLFVASELDDGVSVFKVDASGQLSNVDNVTDAGALELNGAASVTTAVIGGATYLFVASDLDHGVSVFEVDDGGLLTNVDNVSNGGTLDLLGAASVTTAVIGGTTYLFVASRFDDNINVFSAAPAPEMDVSGMEVSITDGDASPSAADDTDFGAVALTGGSNANTFAITNSGDAVLNLTGTPRVVIGGTNAGDFTLTTDAAASVAAAGGKTTFTITFDPGANGLRTATVSIANDDADENPYNFNIAGTGINTSPTGAVLITGTATQGQTLTADASGVADADGLGAFSFQWRANGTNIAGATASTYPLTQAEVGKTIDVVVSYTDGGSTAESVTSAATGAVIGTFTLTAGKTGLGTGTLSSAPAGINCGVDCTEIFNDGTSVTLNHAADAGAVFTSWSGDCTGSGACVVTMDQARNVSARFELSAPGATTLFSAVLPSARSGFFPGGSPITVFASVINAGGNPAQSCVVSIPAGSPVTLSYQETDATNAPTGPADIPFDIASGQARSFVLAFTPVATSAGEDVFPDFVCDNANVDAIPGVNTVFLTIESAEGPDILSIGATPSADGIINVPSGSIGFMTASAINIGIGDAPGSADTAVTVSADTGAAALPLLLQLCETDAASTCITPLGTDPINTVIGDTPSFFALFVTDQSDGAGVALDPANARSFLRFASPGGTARSVTSAAVTAPAAAGDAPIMARVLPTGRWAVMVRTTKGLLHAQEPGTLSVWPDGYAKLETGKTSMALDLFVAPDGTFTGREANGVLAGQFTPNHSLFMVDAKNDNTRIDIWGVHDTRGLPE